MANYTAYIPAVGSTTYPTQLSNFITLSEAIDTEIENAREGKLTLLANLGLKAPLVSPTFTGNFTSTGIDDNATAIAITIDNTQNIAFGGNVSLADNKHLYLGTGNDLDIYHNGTDSRIHNNTGDFRLHQLLNGGLIKLNSNDSAGVLKSNIICGGAIPKVDLYYAGAIQISTASGGPTINATPALNDNSLKVATTEYVDRVTTPASYRGALVYMAGNQSVADSTLYDLQWDAEIYDTDTIHDNVTNNNRLVVPTGVSRVKITFGVWFYNNSTGFRQYTLRKNGFSSSIGLPVHLENNPQAANGNRWYITTTALTVVPGDYFSLNVYQTSGAPLNIFGGSAGGWMSMEIIE